MEFINNGKVSYFKELEKKDKRIIDILNEVSELPGCKKISALPDSCIQNVEIPNSVVTLFDGFIVPQLIANVINCGMGLIKFDIKTSDVIKHRDSLIENIHTRLKEKPIVLNNKNFLNILENGAPAIIPLLKNISGESLNNISERGESSLKHLRLKKLNHSEIIPSWLLNDNAHLMVPSNNFKGNHFIEWLSKINLNHNMEYTEDSIDNDSSYCSYHFDFQLTTKLNWSYVTRKKERKKIRRRIQNIRSNTAYHTSVEGFWRLLSIYKYYLKARNFTAIPLDSLEGQRYLQAVHFSMNYTYAGRLAFVDTVVSAVKETFGNDKKWEIIFDAGHDTYRAEEYNSNTGIVSRKGCMKADELEYGMISGFHNVPSIMVKPKPITEGNNYWFNSYDHGIGGHSAKDEGFTNKQKSNNLGDVYCYRSFSKDDKFKKAKVHKEPNYISSSLEYALNIYNDNMAPVVPIALLNPFISYRVK